MASGRAAVLMCVALAMARSAEPQTGDAVARALAEDFFAGRFAPMAARFDDRVAQALPEAALTEMRSPTLQPRTLVLAAGTTVPDRT